jgi:hypothetical protein
MKLKELKQLIKEEISIVLKEYGEDSGGQDMTWGYL